MSQPDKSLREDLLAAAEAHTNKLAENLFDISDAEIQRTRRKFGLSEWSFGEIDNPNFRGLLEEAAAIGIAGVLKQADISVYGRDVFADTYDGLNIKKKRISSIVREHCELVDVTGGLQDHAADLKLLADLRAELEKSLKLVSAQAKKLTARMDAHTLN